MLKKCVYHLVATWKNTTGYSEKWWSRMMPCRGFAMPFLAVETAHGEGKCHLTSPVPRPRLRPASWRHFPSERDKRGWMVVWHKMILFNLYNSLFCLELQFAPRSQPRGEPPAASALLTHASSHSTVPCCRETPGTPVGLRSLQGLAFSTLPTARGDHLVPQNVMMHSQRGM